MDTIVAYFNQTQLFSVRNALAELQHPESVDSAARARQNETRALPQKCTLLTALFHAP